MSIDDSDEDDKLPSVHEILKCTSKHNVDVDRSGDKEAPATIFLPRRPGSKAAPIVLDSSDEDETTRHPVK